jgi:hypothetical protein
MTRLEIANRIQHAPAAAVDGRRAGDQALEQPPEGNGIAIADFAGDRLDRIGLPSRVL